MASLDVARDCLLIVYRCDPMIETETETVTESEFDTATDTETVTETAHQAYVAAA